MRGPQFFVGHFSPCSLADVAGKDGPLDFPRWVWIPVVQRTSLYLRWSSLLRLG
jgi:hypothetical protein